ncbi:class Ib ribonucleoside-diphosphate reductase assembly flavoprotein NrdI [Paenibacillus beijingensis]|uniref:Protein NrdI n=1 Tax=Paenibacillus beijingensis TaxID=1126833 RepID=A0A0D5NF96_9BACL|nr:class Ib ribonucleoside-diphosphate reductase assembly flavoprotein NrdI [Paenibacillus beijingensis]AJY74064.1 ribonucleotide reductase stimulatory protein [Paenibacillus beijingensis]
MLVAFDSRTGNVRKFVRKLNLPSVQIDESLKLDEPFVLITYTTGFGEVPPKVSKFLERNAAYLRGVSASGNRNWGTGFAKSADTLSQRYRVPIVCKFELSGTTRDVEHFMKEVEPLAAY